MKSALIITHIIFILCALSLVIFVDRKRDKVREVGLEITAYVSTIFSLIMFGATVVCMSSPAQDIWKDQLKLKKEVIQTTVKACQSGQIDSVCTYQGSELISKTYFIK